MTTIVLVLFVVALILAILACFNVMPERPILALAVVLLIVALLFSPTGAAVLR